ncbi:AT-hook motif nuclear-localized protein 28-like [Syzygium oleosum]|uniref:AT-hook motif nuclear-localized protein 28-like n=1 Tax=Syzygium oleosum TaxID=219896 RepID=UPI0024B966EB|nr:AT-hook motif nuclear-localized protein 28-like [Syzygium oleosum]
MKGEYLHPKKTSSPNQTAMFSNLHHPRPFSHRFQLDDDPSSTTTSPAPAAPPNKPKPAADHPNPAGDGASIEVVRRPRGRPPGSKNKPKPPLFITRDPEPTMAPYILEVPGGSDVVHSISSFCRRKGIGLCVLAGSGAVANFTLRHPSSSSPGATITFHGRFDILSISATFVAPQVASSTFFVPDGFKISVAGPQGQMLGGSVAGPLVAVGPVFVVAATFNNPSFHRLPAEEDDGGGGGGSSSLSGRGGDGHSPPASGGGESAHPPPQPTAADSGVSMYSCHLPSDVIWAPAPRQAPPY